MMKKIIFSLLMTTVVLSGILFYLTSCQKQQEGLNKQTNNQISIDEESQAMTSHVLAFKAKMEYYRNNPDLKTGGELYSADSAVLELESLLNYNFCYTGIECNKKTFELSEVTMPLDELAKINDPDLMQVYYDKVIDTIQAQMGRVDYENMKLLLVDLENTGTDSNGDAIVSVGALIGNQLAVPTPPYEIGWWYGYLGGTCAHAHEGILDAALILEGDLRFAHIPAPPPNMMRRYTIIHTEGPLIPNHPDYRIENDPLDNYMDYRVYYATTTVGAITDATKCISNDIEMPFYLGQYDDFIDEFEIQYQLEFVDCLLEGYIPPDESYIQHDYRIYLGNVWLVPVGWVIEDIMTYNN